MTTTEARQEIDLELRQEAGHYTFEDLDVEFEEAYDEAVEDGVDYVTIKIPSAYECSFPIMLVAKAIGR